MPEQAPTVVHHQLSLWMEIAQSGIFGVLVFLLVAAVFLGGMVLLFLPASSRIRRAYLVAPLLPVALSLVATALGTIRAFSVLGVSGFGDGSKFCEALWEVSFPVQLALFGAALAYTLSAVAFLRAPRPPGG